MAWATWPSNWVMPKRRALVAQLKEKNTNLAEQLGDAKTKFNDQVATTERQRRRAWLVSSVVFTLIGMLLAIAILSRWDPTTSKDLFLNILNTVF